MVRSQRYLEIIEEENLVENARSVGEYLVNELQKLASEFPSVVSNPRGRGLFAAFDVNTPDMRTKIRAKSLEKGLIILPSGEKSIRFRPALNVTKDEINEGLGIIRESIKQSM
jgi:L-lysine 6-transaminase